MSAPSADGDGEEAVQKGVRYRWAVKGQEFRFQVLVWWHLGRAEHQHLLGASSKVTASGRVWLTIATAAGMAPQQSLAVHVQQRQLRPGEERWVCSNIRQLLIGM